MKQALHIFRKDVRFLWLPILMVLALTAVFASHQPIQVVLDGGGAAAEGDIFGAAGFFLVLAWWYLITAAIYKERPIGDRQFWVTRPYSWKSLVGAKVLLIVTFISMPFLISDVAILVARGIPLSAGGLVWRQAAVASVYLLPMAALASVTRYYAQIAITLVAGLLLLVFGVWNPGRQIGFWGPLEWIPASFVGALLFAAGLGVMAWQYAERRSWAGRGVLVAAVGLCLATPRIQPPDAAVVLASSWWEPEDLQPIRLRFVARRLGLERGISRAETFSLQVEGVPAQMLAEPELLKVSIHGARGNSWDSGWRPRDSASFTTTWMSSGGEMPNPSIQVRIDEELADRTRPVGTRIEVAMTIYRLGTSVPIKSDGRRHEIPGIGSCWIGMGAFGQALSCDSAGYPAALARIYGAEDVGTSGRIFIQRAMPLRWYGALFDLNPVLSWSTGMQGDAAQMLTVEWPVARIRREITLDRPWQRAR